ncbi:hypothetical protein TRFO_17100 [Tritrichomonas foetus]|uniref:Uncharacterized protein n=1 Tax=Tritrichomonas foetus TaxID=1144522 RepID=A0A1J4KTN6_9EUKA|nr:hypothetical protein TRFO_17100 [Tritrichomonas foetus]|eukprot:OHT12853.1 hypothetical protein TRFO_17100 [Tritrichomonas foetus]
MNSATFYANNDNDWMNSNATENHISPIKHTHQNISRSIQIPNSNSDEFHEESSDNYDSLDDTLMNISKGPSIIVDNSCISFSEHDDIIFKNQKYHIESIEKKDDTSQIFKVVDELDREFTLKKYNFYDNLTDLLSIYNSIKDNKNICYIEDVDISYEKYNMTIIMERSSPIIAAAMNANKRMKSIKNILSAIHSFASIGLNCSSLTIDDFVETTHGVKLMNFENLKIPHTQIFRIPTIEQIQQSKDDSTFNLYKLVKILLCNDNTKYSELFNDKKKAIIPKLQSSTISDIPELLTDEFFMEEIKKVVISGSVKVVPSPKKVPPYKLAESISNSSHTSEAKMSQMDFSLCIGILLMLTVSLILKGIHEADFGITRAYEVFFGLRFFWIFLIGGLFYIVIRIKSVKAHKKIISKKIYRYIIVIGIVLFLINASLVFHLLISRCNARIPSFTLCFILLWILWALSLISQ